MARPKPKPDDESYTFVDGTDRVDEFLADDIEAVALSDRMLEDMYDADRQHRDLS